MGWTLAELRALDADEFEDLVEWAQTRSKAKDDDEIDADEIVAGLDERKRREAETDGGSEL